MSILQCAGDLVNVGNNSGEWDTRASGMSVPQSTVGSIVHYNKRHMIVYTKISHLHNMRVLETNSTCFVEKTYHITISQLRQYFDSHAALTMHIVSKIYFTKASCT